jgi:hypothetical protein
LDVPPLSSVLTLLVLLGAGLWAGIQNALAGGGSFVTLPALILSGMDARAANITSTLALFPGQVVTGYANRKLAQGSEGLSLRALMLISLAGGVAGAALLLLTPSSVFEKMVPWLVLAATLMFAWGGRRKPAASGPALSPRVAGAVQFFIAVYGGYFGGGIGFLMLAALTLAGLEVLSAAATKNVLAAVMNASAVLIFLFSGEVRWLSGVALSAGAVAGGLAGAWLLPRAPAKVLRAGVIALGVALTVGLFLRSYG